MGTVPVRDGKMGRPKGGSTLTPRRVHSQAPAALMLAAVTVGTASATPALAW